MHYFRCSFGNKRGLPASKCLRIGRYVNAGSNADAVSNRSGSITDSGGISIANGTRRRCDSGAHGGANPDPNRSEADWQLGDQRQSGETERERNVGNPGQWKVQVRGRLRTQDGNTFNV